MRWGWLHLSSSASWCLECEACCVLRQETGDWRWPLDVYAARHRPTMRSNKEAVKRPWVTRWRYHRANPGANERCSNPDLRSFRGPGKRCVDSFVPSHHEEGVQDTITIRPTIPKAELQKVSGGKLNKWINGLFERTVGERNARWAEFMDYPRRWFKSKAVPID